MADRTRHDDTDAGGEGGTDSRSAADLLERRASFVTSSRDWLGACVEAFYRPEGRASHGSVVELGEHAWAPLVRARRHHLAWLELAGSRHLFEPGEFICSRAESLDVVFRRLVETGLPIELSRIRPDRAVIDALRRNAEGRGFVVLRKAPPAMYAPLGGGSISLPEVMSSLRRRRDLERTARRLAERGRVDYAWIRPGPGDVDDVVARAARVEDSGWKREQSRSMLRRPTVSAFVRALTRAFAARGRLIVAFLSVDGRPIAMQVILEFNGAWHELKIGHDADWRNVSPGTQLGAASLLKAGEENMQRYEFMGNEEPRHQAFACQRHELVTLVYVPYSLRGLLVSADIAAGAIARRAGARLRSPGR